jgi:hypothetical protein
MDDSNQMWKPAAIGGILLGILSAIPPFSFFNCACCAWVIGGGVLAAHFYVKASPTVVSLGNGLFLGLLTGAIGGAVTTVFNIPMQILMRGIMEQYAGEARQMISEIPNLPPAVREIVQNASAGKITPIVVLFSLFFNITIYGVVAMLGGALGVAIFEKRKAEPPLPNIPPPPPPPPPLQL